MSSVVSPVMGDSEHPSNGNRSPSETNGENIRIESRNPFVRPPTEIPEDTDSDSESSESETEGDQDNDDKKPNEPNGNSSQTSVTATTENNPNTNAVNDRFKRVKLFTKFNKARPNGGFWSVSETHTDKIPDRVGALNELRHYTKDADNLKSDKSKLNLQNGQKQKITVITVLPGLVNQKEENSKNSLERRSSIPIVPEVQNISSATTVQNNDTPQNTAQYNNQTAPIPSAVHPIDRVIPRHNTPVPAVVQHQPDLETSISTPQNQTYTKPDFIDTFQSRFNLLEQTFKEIQTKLVAEATSEYGHLRERISDLEGFITRIENENTYLRQQVDQRERRHRKDQAIYELNIERLIKFTDSIATNQNREKFDQLRSNLHMTSNITSNTLQQQQHQVQKQHLQQQSQQQQKSQPHIQQNIQQRNNINYYQPTTGYEQSQPEVPLSFRHDSGASVHYTPSVSQSVQYPNVPQPRTAPQQQVRPSVPPTQFSVPISVQNQVPPAGNNFGRYSSYSGPVNGFSTGAGPQQGLVSGNQYHPHQAQVSGNRGHVNNPGHDSQAQSGNPQQYYKQPNAAFSHQP